MQVWGLLKLCVNSGWNQQIVSSVKQFGVEGRKIQAFHFNICQMKSFDSFCFKMMLIFILLFNLEQVERHGKTWSKISWRGGLVLAQTQQRCRGRVVEVAPEVLKLILLPNSCQRMSPLDHLYIDTWSSGLGSQRQPSVMLAASLLCMLHCSFAYRVGMP